MPARKPTKTTRKAPKRHAAGSQTTPPTSAGPPAVPPRSNLPRIGPRDLDASAQAAVDWFAEGEREDVVIQRLSTTFPDCQPEGAIRVALAYFATLAGLHDNPSLTTAQAVARGWRIEALRSVFRRALAEGDLAVAAATIGRMSKEVG